MRDVKLTRASFQTREGGATDLPVFISKTCSPALLCTTLGYLLLMTGKLFLIIF